MKGVVKLIVLVAFIGLTVTVLSGQVVGRQEGSLPGPEVVVEPANGAGLVLKLDPVTSTVTVGDVFTVDLLVEGAEGLTGFDVDLDFDPAFVQIIDTELGDFLENSDRNFILLDAIDNGAGTAVISTFSLGDDPGPAGSGVLVTITLEAVAVGSSPLDLYDAKVWDPDLENVAAPGDGHVEVTPCVPVTVDGLASDSPVAVGETMHFTATVTGSEPITYTWDFGGAGTATGEDTATPAYTYDAVGDYTVAFTATNACGVAADALEVVVAPPCEPVEIVSVVSDSPVVVGRAMHFTATVTGSEPITYTWDFGGAGTATGETTATPAFTYDAVGSYTVALTVENCGGAAQDVLDTVAVQVTPCVPVTVDGLASDSPVAVGETMHFTATVTGSEPITYTWDFGGAGTATGEDTATPAYTYDAVGDYTVAFTATNACGVAADALEVVVAPPCEPVEIVSLTSDSPVAVGGTMHFTATVSGSEPIDYTWDFGGAGTLVGGGEETGAYVYDEPGTYTVTLTAENCPVLGPFTDRVVLVVTVTCDPVMIDDFVSDSPVTLGEAMHFTATVSGSEPVSYTWDFGGDGTPVGGGEGTGTFLYDEPGTYTVTLTAENYCGTDEEMLVVDVCGPVSIDDLVSDSPVAIGETMHFTAMVMGSEPINYAWDFGGAGSGSALETAKPAFDYDAVGTYTVTLAVENACGADEGTLAVEVTEMQRYLPVVLRTYPPCVEKVINGGFELDTGWTMPVTEYPAAYSAAAAHSGSRSMRVGIVEPAEDVYSYSSAQQAVSIPADAAGVTLRFHLFPISGEASAAVGFRAPPVAGAMEEAVLSDDVQYVLVLDEDDQQLGGSLIWQKSDSREWTFHTFDLSEPPYAGRTVKLTFGVYNDGVDGVTGMYVDDVSLVVCDASP